MKSIAQIIKENRKLKGLSQEDLAEKSSVNLRTIQRIENEKNQPRDTTLHLLAEALEISFEDFKTASKTNCWHKALVNIFQSFGLVLVNLILMGILGFLTLDSNANINSLFGAVLLSILIPLFIVQFTSKISNIQRMLKFGTGYFLYIILIIGLHGLPIGFTTGLIPCALISLFFLYFGNDLTVLKDQINHTKSNT